MSLLFVVGHNRILNVIYPEDIEGFGFEIRANFYMVSKQVIIFVSPVKTQKSRKGLARTRTEPEEDGSSIPEVSQSKGVRSNKTGSFSQSSFLSPVWN